MNWDTSICRCRVKNVGWWLCMAWCSALMSQAVQSQQMQPRKRTLTDEATSWCHGHSPAKDPGTELLEPLGGAGLCRGVSGGFKEQGSSKNSQVHSRLWYSRLRWDSGKRQRSVRLRGHISPSALKVQFSLQAFFLLSNSFSRNSPQINQPHCLGFETWPSKQVHFHMCSIPQSSMCKISLLRFKENSSSHGLSFASHKLSFAFVCPKWIFFKSQWFATEQAKAMMSLSF